MWFRSLRLLKLSRGKAGISFAFVLFVFGYSSVGFARQGLVPGSRYTTPRSAALGDAFISLADDSASGLFFNPAGLGSLSNKQRTGLEISGYFNINQLTSFDPGIVKSPSLSSYLPNLQNSPDYFHGSGFSVMPYSRLGPISFGVLLNSQIGAQANSDGTVLYKSLYQIIPAIGTGASFYEGILRIGYSLQWVNQASGTVTVSSTSEPLGYNQNITQGSGLSHNLGLTFDPFALRKNMKRSWKFGLPKFDLVTRNMFGLRYSNSSLVNIARNSTGVPSTENMAFDAALSFMLKGGVGPHSNLVFEMKDLLSSYHLPLEARFSAGLELGFKKFNLRAGWNSGAPTLGFAVKTKGAEWSIAYFSEELGTSYREYTDQRILFGYRFIPSNSFRKRR